MSFLKALFSPRDDNAMKTIAYRGGVVTFRIPARWHEKYSDLDGGLFYESRVNLGRVLRLKVLTLKSPKDLDSASGPEVLKAITSRLQADGVRCTVETRNDGNAVLKYEEASSERGVGLNIFHWMIANPLPPRRARIATFSYTIRANEREDSNVQRDLRLLEAEIQAAAFSPTLGMIRE